MEFENIIIKNRGTIFFILIKTCFINRYLKMDDKVIVDKCNF